MIMLVILLFWFVVVVYWCLFSLPGREAQLPSGGALPSSSRKQDVCPALRPQESWWIHPPHKVEGQYLSVKKLIPCLLGEASKFQSRFTPGKFRSQGGVEPSCKWGYTNVTRIGSSSRAHFFHGMSCCCEICSELVQEFQLFPTKYNRHSYI